MFLFFSDSHKQSVFIVCGKNRVIVFAGITKGDIHVSICSVTGKNEKEKETESTEWIL